MKLLIPVILPNKLVLVNITIYYPPKPPSQSWFYMDK